MNEEKGAEFSSNSTGSNSVPTVTNPRITYSAAKRLARELLGPSARITQTPDGDFRIYTEVGRTRTIYGQGNTYWEALGDCLIFEGGIQPAKPEGA